MVEVVQTEFFKDASGRNMDVVGDAREVELSHVNGIFEKLGFPLVGYRSVNNRLSIAYDVELGGDVFTLNVSLRGGLGSKTFSDLQMNVTFFDYLQEKVQVDVRRAEIAEKLKASSVWKDLELYGFVINPDMLERLSKIFK